MEEATKNDFEIVPTSGGGAFQNEDREVEGSLFMVSSWCSRKIKRVQSYLVYEHIESKMCECCK